jgi:hypothetical protein
MTTISSFIKRLAKIGVKVELSSNYPWVYLDKVNGKQVTNRFYGNHGFTVFFRATRVGDRDTITDIGIIFKKIREML